MWRPNIGVKWARCWVLYRTLFRKNRVWKIRAENESGYVKILNLMLQILVDLGSSNYTTRTFSGFSPSVYTNLRHYKTEGFFQCDLIRKTIVLRHNSCPFHWNIQQQYKKKFEIHIFVAKCHAYEHACVRLHLNSSKTTDNFWKWMHSHLIL